MKNFYKKGISAVELLVVLSILGILFLLVMPQFSKNRDLQVLKGGVQGTLSSLNKARTQTLSSLNSSEYGVHVQSDKLVIFKGKVFSAGAADNETISIVAPAIISNVTFGGVSSTSGDVYFSRLSGVPSTTGTITISANSFSKIITISATGVVSSN